MQTLPVTPEENAFLDRVSGCPRDPADPYGCEHYRVHGSHAFSGGLCNDCGFQRPIQRGEQETTTRFYVAYFSESSRDPRRFPSIAAAVREFRDDVETRTGRGMRTFTARSTQRTTGRMPSALPASDARSTALTCGSPLGHAGASSRSAADHSQRGIRGSAPAVSDQTSDGGHVVSAT